MTVFKHPKGNSFRYDFYFRGQRHTGNTLQTTRADALIVESDLKKKLRLQAGGLLPPEPIASPRFQDWAEIYLDHVIQHRKDIGQERVQNLLRVVLRFWGARPAPTATGRWAAREGEPYHDLTLRAPIDDPMWLVRFEDWMNTKGIEGQTKNHYRSALSQLYRLALQPAYRARTGVMMNPFVGVPRDQTMERTATITVEQLQAWLRQASYHVRLAVSIAALAPKLRLANILALRWNEHVDASLQYITVARHKTARSTGRPLVVPIDEQLLAILEDARRRRRGKYVVTYRGRRLKGISGGVKAAAQAAGLIWGRFAENGVTFHTIRHTMATMLAELGSLDGAAPLSESERMRLMGHQRLETTQRYTHIRPERERPALARLSKLTPIAAIVTAPWTRAARKKNTPKEGLLQGSPRRTLKLSTT